MQKIKQKGQGAQSLPAASNAAPHAQKPLSNYPEFISDKIEIFPAY
ncbi:MAG: hypothetical protein N2044_10570 [Cyclobacteriaceae bacterium]|nr:hypothetical protein [Cyclobacteriaceae bacterium]